jgi:hypothetical protein
MRQELALLPRPDGGSARIAIATPSDPRPPYVEIGRFTAEGAVLTRQAFAAEELDRIVAALAEARRLLLGVPDKDVAAKRARSIVGLGGSR